MNLINKLLTKIFWLLLPIVKKGQMNNLVDYIIEEEVIKNFNYIGYKPTIVNINKNKSLSIIYTVEFPDKKTFSFNVEYNNGNVEFLFVETDIKHLMVLNFVVSEIFENLKNSKQEIKKIFEKELENMGNKI